MPLDRLSAEDVRILHLEAGNIRGHVCKVVVLRPVEGRGPVGPERLREIVAGLMAERLDRDHPLWRMDVVETMTDGSMAVIWRMHHCLADGTTMMRLAGELLWSSTPDVAPLAASTWRPAPAPGGIT